jgi:hypothetical protein
MYIVALRLSWYVYADKCTVYWFPSESEPPNYSFDGYVAKTLGRRPDGQHVRIDATPAEVRSWSAAATAYVDEVAASARDLQASKDRARQLRGSWRRSARRRQAEAEGEADAVHRERVGAARARYQPVLEVIEHRLAEGQRAEQAAAAKAAEECRRRLEAARARFEAWERQWALADLPLFDGRSARELAASGEAPAEWPPEIDDPESWWAGVRAAVRNETARVAAVQSITDAIMTVADALDEAGRPGIAEIHERFLHPIHGWWVEFDWSGLPDTDALIVPPKIPVSHIRHGEWKYYLHLPGKKILIPRGAIASPHTETLKGNIGERTRWSFQNAAAFADDLVPRTIYYRSRDGFGGSVSVPITEHADPDAYVPYVRAVAERATASFTAFLARVCGRPTP